MTKQTAATSLALRQKWHPIAEGELGDACRCAVEAIADDLLQPLDCWPLHAKQRAWAVRAVSLASGRAGIALFFFELGRATDEPKWTDKAFDLLNESADALAELVTDASLYCGFTGVGWVTNYVQGSTIGDSASSDSNDEIDDVLCELLSPSPWTGLIDLIGGLAGIGVYLTSRLPRPSARSGLTNLLDRLEEMALRDAHGITWEAPQNRREDKGRSSVAKGRIDLGVSHGVPGIIGLFGLLASTDPSLRRAGAMLGDAVRWLLHTRAIDHEDTVFPHFVDSEHQAKRFRSAWCYGDVGVAATLFHVGHMTGDRELRESALAIGRRAAMRRTVYSSTPLDGGLCHGMAGLVHVYNRFYQSSREDVFRQAAVFWLDRLLASRRPGSGVGGFSAWSVELNRSGAWEADPCFLTGASGVGLALLGAVSDTPPCWDSLLLLGPPPRTTSAVS